MAYCHDTTRRVFRKVLPAAGPLSTHPFGAKASCGNGPAMSRRTMLAAGLAAPVAPVATIAAPSQDPHSTWWEEWKRITAFINDHPTGEDHILEPSYARQAEIELLIAETRATTREGIVAQMEWLIEDGDGYWGSDRHDTLARNVVTALQEGLA